MLVDGQGVHLTDVLYAFKEKDLIPDWIDFIKRTIETNWKLEGTIEKISQSCFEVYGPEYRDQVLIRIKTWVIHEYGG